MDKIYEQLPIVSVEGIPIKELSERFIDWYFSDNLSQIIIKKIKAQALAEKGLVKLDDVMKIIEHEIDYEKNFMMSGFKVRTSVKLLQELKAKLQSPQTTHGVERIDESLSLHTRSNESGDNIQKAISEFKEKLIKRLTFQKGYGLVTGEIHYDTIIAEIEKTAQEITK